LSTVNEQFEAALRKRVPDDQREAPSQLSDYTSPAAARAGQADSDAVTASTAETMGLPFVETLNSLPISHDFIMAVPIAFARQHVIMGVAGEDGATAVALSDLTQWPVLDTLSKLIYRRIEPFFAPRNEILRAINAAYQQDAGGAQRLIDQFSEDDVVHRLDGESVGNEDLLDVASRAPVIKLVNLVLLEAVKRGASDVHVQPYEERLVVRFRIDGVLRDIFEPPKALHPEIISRIKVMGGMNIAEHRLPQDGRATVEVGDRIVDLRISSLPTSFGERAVIRLLDKSIHLYSLQELAMPAEAFESLEKVIHTDHGIFLVTGPTGSGKSTTLYAALQEVNSKELNILTLEDPIEYRLEGISQTQVSEKKGMTFASGLRHVLRQDPDIIMLGEIRDGETARMAIQSALTGHMVFSTLHTNDAAGAVARMLDLGVEPYLLASSLLGVQAQRLVRRICPHCREEYVPAANDLRRWNIAADEKLPEKLYRGAGCDRCLDLGYSGRMGIFELLLVSEPIRELILQRGKASSIKAVALQSGMKTLRADGLAKAAAGLTTMDEVARVTSRDEF